MLSAVTVRSFLVGTAGHIDHGKSALVLALTGTDPDRLKEEKERGITIDLGFAHLDLGEGLVASFIDVPGHERFVRNMLAGAHGLDAVVLVVSAEESVMPQTREHFHVCRLLGLPRGLVALTKCDLADTESQALAELEVRELVKGSFLEGRPVLRVSARTGEGLEPLRSALRALAQEAAPRKREGLLRLPVDRAFTMRGFGTVATGTLVSGTVRVGDEVEVLPGGRGARVRGLQIHGQPVDEVPAGSRAAVNLAGLEVDEIARGDVLARPGTLRPSSMLDVQITLLPEEKPLADQARVRVHLASAEILARVRVLGAPAVAPGAPSLVQIRLERPGVAGRGDPFILRSYSPARTIGGGRVLDPLPRKRRTRAVSAAPGLGSLAEADPAAAAAWMIEEAGGAGIEAAELAARVTEPLSGLAGALAGVAEVVALGAEPVAFMAKGALDDLGRIALARLERFHRDQPLRAAMAREELRRQVFARAPAPAFERVLRTLADSGDLRLLPDAVALARHSVRLTSSEEEARAALLEAAGAAGPGGIETAELAARTGRDAKLLERVSRTLLEARLLERVGEARLVHRDALEALRDDVRRRWPPGSRLDVGAFKELTGLSRKFVIPLLEYLDRERVTRRAGAERFVL
jgi:selenocysteine-specific elongation factor